MNALVCEMCQSNELVKENGMYVCQHCGTKYTVEEARKLLGSVKIDKSEETEKLIALARRAREENNSINAEKYYALVLLECPNNWEATFFQVYFQSLHCTLAELETTARSIANCITSTYQLIAIIESEEERNSASDTVISYCCDIIPSFGAVAKKHWDTFIRRSLDVADMNRNQNLSNELKRRLFSLELIYINLETELKKNFCNNQNTILRIQKAYHGFMCDYSTFFYDPEHNSIKQRLTLEIQRYDPTFQKADNSRKNVSSKSGGGCYVATAVYGSYDCPEVWTLRRYRDNTLAKTWYGRAFIRTYYAISPTLVKWFGNTTWFKKLWKGKLDCMVKTLQENGYDSTPYVDRKW